MQRLNFTRKHVLREQDNVNRVVVPPRFLQILGMRNVLLIINVPDSTNSKASG